MADEENPINSEAEGAVGSSGIGDSSNFEIRKIYLKDASLESPHAPGIFLTAAQQPEVTIDASIKANPLEQEEYFDVTLGITVTATIEEQTAFLVEVHQSGVFLINGIPEEDMPLALEIACPNILLPFAREAIADLVAKAGFPQLLLSPINFEGLYQQKQLAKQQQTQ